MESFIYVIATGQYYYPILHVLQQPFVIFQLADGECRKLLGALAVCTFRTSYYRVSRRWGFPELGVRQKWWFIMENSVKMDDGGTPISGNLLLWGGFQDGTPNHPKLDQFGIESDPVTWGSQFRETPLVDRHDWLHLPWNLQNFQFYPTFW